MIKGMSLETTLFDRLLALHGSSIKRMLTTQYRMHERIMRFPSDELYGSELIAADAVKARLLTALEYDIEDGEDTNEPLIFIDTQGGDFPERNEEEDKDNPKKGKSSLHGESKSNDMEAALVRRHVKQLVGAGLKADDIAVVTPYNAQASSHNHRYKWRLANYNVPSSASCHGTTERRIPGYRTWQCGRLPRA